MNNKNINSIVNNYIKKPKEEYILKNNFLNNNQKKNLKIQLVYLIHMERI